jgi:signal transduction histidine kinase
MKWGRSDTVRYCAILAAIMIISALHYGTSTEHRYLHEIYQRLYYIPILLAAYWYGPLLGIISASLTSLLYIYHIEKDWSHIPVYSFNQYAEIFLFHALALIIGLLSRKDKRRRLKLEKTSSELAAAYRKLQQTFDQLKQADRLAALGQLSAGIAHEIRNPLGSIKGSVEILEKDIPPDSSKKEFITIIKEETARLNRIVGEFLKFARPPKLSVEPTSVNELIQSTLTLLEQQPLHHRVEIHRQLDAKLPMVSLDPDQIRQVFLNVVINGVQAMPEGGTLSVRSFCDPDQKSVAVEISDTGEGVEEECLDRVFDPFFTTKSQGTGLGLSISYQLVDLHGGRIRMEKNPEKGVTVRIDFPQ